MRVCVSVEEKLREKSYTTRFDKQTKTNDAALGAVKRNRNRGRIKMTERTCTGGITSNGQVTVHTRTHCGREIGLSIGRIRPGAFRRS